MDLQHGATSAPSTCSSLDLDYWKVNTVVRCRRIILLRSPENFISQRSSGSPRIRGRDPPSTASHRHHNGLCCYRVEIFCRLNWSSLQSCQSQTEHHSSIVAVGNGKRATQDEDEWVGGFVDAWQGKVAAGGGCTTHSLGRRNVI